MTDPPGLRLLVVSQYWEPAELAGGARSTARALDALGASAQIWVFAGDRDVGETEPWPTVEPGWHDRGHRRVWHQPWDRRSAARLRGAIAEVDPDVIYLPSLFAPGSLAVLWRRAIGRLRLPVVVAPEGELHPGALAHHRARKQIVVALVRLTGLGWRVRWRAADAGERAHLHAALGRRAQVEVAPDLHDPLAPAPAPPIAKQPGSARVIFVSSIVPKKGLAFALEVLWPLRQQVRFDIYGPIVDADEWARCRAVLDRCEPDVAWLAHGPVAHEAVHDLLAEADLCILATRGENYGYAIAEALEAGCPVLTSDQTPWRDLAADGCGWDLPLDPIAPWQQCVTEVIAWDDGSRRVARDAARRRAADAWSEAEHAASAWRSLLDPNAPTSAR